MISGLIGGGAAQGLEELLARQLLEAQQAERERATRAQEGLAQSRLAQDASQHSDLVGLRQAEMDQRASEFDAETQQRSIDALHKNTDKMDARLSRLQGEEDQMAAAEALQAELSALMGDPNVADIDKRALRLRRLGVTSAPHATDAEQQAADQRDINKAAAIASATERARAENRPPPQPKGANGELTASGAAENAAEVARLAEALKSHKGFGSVFGTVQGAIPSMRQDSVDAEAIRDRLISSLTLENIGKLKGVLSDRDMQVLREAATSLRPRMGDQAAAAELDRIIGAMNRRGSVTPAPSHSSAPGPRRIRFDARGNRIPE